MTQPGVSGGIPPIQPPPFQPPVNPNPKPPTPEQQAQDALAPNDPAQGLETMTQIAAGNRNVTDHPGLMAAMLNSNATPQQAQAINQFVDTLHAVKMVNLAKTGMQLNLTPEQQFGLQAMGVDYQSTLTKQATTATATLASMGLQVQRDQDGNVITDPTTGQPLTKPIPAPSHSSGGNWFTRVAGGVLGALGKGVNLVDAAISNQVDQSLGILNSGNPLQTAPQQQQAQTNAGYGTDFASSIAFMASGHAKSGYLLQQAAQKWDDNGNASKYGIDGNAAIDEITKYSANPADYIRQIELDPALTMQEKVDKQNLIGSPEFQDMAKRIGASNGLFGDYAANALGVDAAKSPGEFTAIALPLNFAEQIVTDPLLLAGKLNTAAKAVQVGIKGVDGALSPEMIRNAYTADTSGVNRVLNRFNAAVQQTGQRFLDQTAIIRDAKLNPTDIEKQAAMVGAMANIRSGLPQFMPLVEDLTSGQRGVFDVVKQADGTMKTVMTRVAEDKPITTIADLGEYMASKDGIVKLASGKAAQEWSYLPGASGFRFAKALQGTLAGNRAAAREMRTLLSGDNSVLGALATPEDALPIQDLNSAVQAAEAAHAPLEAASQGVTTAVAGLMAAKTEDFASATDKLEQAVQSARTAGVSSSIANNALDVAKQGVANPSALGDFRANLQQLTDGLQEQLQGSLADSKNTLLSARRAATERMSAISDPTLRAEIQASVFKKGSAAGESWDLPNLFRARSEAVGRRLSAYLPRNTVFDLNDASTTEKVVRFGRLFMNDADAERWGALYASGDIAQKESVMRGMLLQTMHSAGMGQTDAGREMIQKKAAEFGIDKSGDLGGIGHEYSASGLAEYRDPLNGDRLSAAAIHTSQTRDLWEFPSFQTMLQTSANNTISMKFFNGILGSKLSNGMMRMFKTFQLLKPSTWTRNALEGWLNVSFRGEGWEALAVKHVLDERDYNAIKDVRAQASAEGWSKAKLKDELDNQRSLYARRLGQDKLAQVAPIHRMVAVYHAATGKFAGPLEQYIKWVRELPPEELRSMAEGFGEQHRMADLDPTNQHYLEGAVRSGLTPQKYSLASGKGSPFEGMAKKNEGWDKAATDGYEGAERMSAALGRIWGSSDVTGRAKFAAAAGKGDAQSVLDAHKTDPAEWTKFQTMRLGRLIDDPEVGTRYAIPGSVEDQAAGHLSLAQRQVADTIYHVSSPDGVKNDKLLNHILKNNETPDANWIQANIPEAERPAWVSAPKYTMVPPDGLGQNALGNALNSVEGISNTAYDYMVEHPIQRTTTMPVFMMNYGKSRQFYEGLKPGMLESGLSEEAATHLLSEYAMKAAWTRTETMIDDPGLMTQMDIVGRNFLAYSRAAQAMVRRWGQLIIEDPARVEKIALTYQASTHSGFIYTDKNGEPTYTYLGSGALTQALARIDKFLPGMGAMSMIPFKSDLNGKVLLSVPGAENPLKIGLTAMANVPVRIVEAHMHGTARQTIDKIDRMINGPVGAGQIGSNFEPTLLKKFFTAMDHTTANGTFSSAYMGALQNAIAAHADGLGSNPTADQQQQFLDRIRISTINQLYTRAILGAFLPAAPSGPDETVKGKTEVDPAFRGQGLQGLSDEYKQILNNYGGDVTQTNALWAAMHPDKLAFEIPFTKPNSKSTYLPATDQTLAWLQANTGFAQKYKSIAAYFVPQGDGSASFNYEAYREELSLGLRIRQAPNDFLNAILLKNQQTEYYLRDDNYKAARQAAVNAGDTQGVKTMDAQFKAWSKDFRAANPLYAATGADQAAASNHAKDQIASLKNMVNANEMPTGIDGGALKSMLNAYDTYEQWKKANPGNSAAAVDMRTITAADYQKFMLGKAGNSPQLREIYDGIFRQLDPKLTYLSADN